MFRSPSNISWPTVLRNYVLTILNFDNVLSQVQRVTGIVTNICRCRNIAIPRMRIYPTDKYQILITVPCPYFRLKLNIFICTSMNIFYFINPWIVNGFFIWNIPRRLYTIRVRIDYLRFRDDRAFEV